MEEFVACFAEVVDPRQENARHDLHELLMIALCTMLCGGEDCSDMVVFGRAKEPFLRQFLRLRHGIPSHDTFSRVFRLLDPIAFAAASRSSCKDFPRPCKGLLRSTARRCGARSIARRESRRCTWSMHGAPSSGCCMARSRPRRSPTRSP